MPSYVTVISDVFRYQVLAVCGVPFRVLHGFISLLFRGEDVAVS